MPQELRWPENRTDEADVTVTKVINLYGKINTYGTKGLADFAFAVSWGDVYDTDLPVIDTGIQTIDEVLGQFKTNKTTPKTTKIKDPFSEIAP